MKRLELLERTEELIIIKSGEDAHALMALFQLPVNKKVRRPIKRHFKHTPKIITGISRFFALLRSTLLRAIQGIHNWAL